MLEQTSKRWFGFSAFTIGQIKEIEFLIRGQSTAVIFPHWFRQIPQSSNTGLFIASSDLDNISAFSIDVERIKLNFLNSTNFPLPVWILLLHWKKKIKI
ncbi:MAG: hypothetical protein PVI90_01480 [Desulfobacteraceae bacterium]|jgi:hypothetical protein